MGSWPTSLVHFSGKNWREGMCHSLMESRSAINTITFTPFGKGVDRRGWISVVSGALGTQTTDASINI